MVKRIEAADDKITSTQRKIRKKRKEVRRLRRALTQAAAAPGKGDDKAAGAGGASADVSSYEEDVEAAVELTSGDEAVGAPGGSAVGASSGSTPTDLEATPQSEPVVLGIPASTSVTMPPASYRPGLQRSASSSSSDLAIAKRLRDAAAELDLLLAHLNRLRRAKSKAEFRLESHSFSQARMWFGERGGI